MNYPEDELAKRRRTHASVQTADYSQQGYDTDELRRYHAEVREIERDSLADRKAAEAEFFETMRDDPETVAQRVGWVINGTHGAGAQIAAQKILGMGPRANKAAALVQIAGTLDWRCPAKHVIAAWKRLTPAQKAKLDHAVKAAIARQGD